MSAILNTFKSKQPFLLVLLPFILIAFWYKWLMNPVLDIDESSLMPLSLYLFNCLKDSPVYIGVLSIAISLIIAFYIYYINDRYAIIKVGSAFPAFLYVLFVACLPNAIGFNPALFASLLVAIAFSRILYAYNAHNSISCFFDAGFLIGLASAFYFQSIYFTVFFMIGMMNIARFNFREVIALLVGVFLPFLFIGTYFLYMDDLPHFYTIIEKSVLLTKIYEVANVFELVLLAYMGLLLLISISSMFLRNPLSEVFELKFFTIQFWILLPSVLLSIVYYPLGAETLAIAVIPLAFFVARYFAVQRHKYYGDVLFVILLLSVIIIQFPSLLNLIYPNG
jgi:hypothetical protein